MQTTLPPSLSSDIAQAVPKTTVLVRDETSAASALAQFKALKGALKAAEAKYDAIADPIKDGLKKLKGEFDRVTAPLKESIEAHKGALERWDRQQREAADKAQRAIDDAQRKVEAVAKAQGVTAPPAPVVVPVAPMPTQRVPKWRVVDESKVPLEMMIDGQMVRLWDLNQGVITNIRRGYGERPSPIPGIEFHYESVVTAR